MKVLIIGSSARAHILVKAALKSSKVGSVICAPGNGGIRQDAECRPLDLEDVNAALELVQSEQPDLVIIGPEKPQYLGLVNKLRERGITTYGATKHAMQLEAYKTYAKDFCHKYGIPTPSSAQFDNQEEAFECLEGESFPTAIKVDQLDEGSGVHIVHSLEEGKTSISSIFEAGSKRVLIEEYISGEEISIQLIVNGEDYILLPFAQDYKRLNDEDTGPNTAGMGAHAPSNLITEELEAILKQTVIEPTLRGMRQEGIGYHGSLSIGLILTPQGPQVLDFKMRFGDPECQVVLPLITEDIIHLMHQAAEGFLETQPLKIREQFSVAISKVSAGYPQENTSLASPIDTPHQPDKDTDILYSEASTDEDNRLIAGSGRVLTIIATKSTLPEAAMEAYALAQKVRFDGEHYRKDIGVRQIERMAHE